MKKIVKIYLFIFSLLPVFGFSETPVDSLFMQLAELKKNQSEDKVKLLIELSWTFRRINTDSTLFYGQEALKISQDIDNKLGEANALKNIGIAWNIKGMPDSALIYMNQALVVSEEMEDNYLIPRNLNNIGLAYQQIGGYEIALEYYLQSLAISEAFKDPIEGVTLMNLGLLEQKSSNYDEALKYFLRALEFAKFEKNSVRMASCYYNIGAVYKGKYSLLLSLQYFKKAEKLAQTNKDKLLLGKIYNSIGRIHSSNKNIEDAKVYFLKGLNLGKEINNNKTIVDSWLGLARLDREEGKFNTSIEKANIGLSIVKKINAKFIEVKFLRVLADNYASLDKYKNAFTYEKAFFKASDEIFNKNKTQKLNALRIQRQISKKEAELAVLTSQQINNEAIIQQQSTRISVFIIVFLLFCLISLILYRLIKVTKNQNKLLEEKVAERTLALQRTNLDLRNSNEELERFAFITSHDLKEPLRNITGFTGLLERKLGKDLDDEGKTFIRFVQRNTKQMHKLIEDVLRYSTIGKENEDYRIVKTNRIMSRIRENLSTQIKEKNATITYGELHEFEGNPEHVFIILKSLIENGIKYNKSELPNIKINSTIVQKEIVFSVEDNGIGIATEFHEQIFMMFKRLHNRQDYIGSGLGLSLVKKLVERMNGKIWLKSEEGLGSTFYFSLPLQQKKQFISNIDIPLELVN